MTPTAKRIGVGVLLAAAIGQFAYIVAPRRITGRTAGDTPVVAKAVMTPINAAGDVPARWRLGFPLGLSAEQSQMGDTPSAVVWEIDPPYIGSSAIVSKDRQSVIIGTGLDPVTVTVRLAVAKNDTISEVTRTIQCVAKLDDPEPPPPGPPAPTPTPAPTPNPTPPPTPAPTPAPTPTPTPTPPPTPPVSDQPITPNDPEITKAAAVFYGGTLDGYGAVMDSLKGAQPSTVDYNASTKAQTEASAAARTILAKATDAKAQAEIDLNTKKFTNPAQAYTTYGLIRNSLAEGMRQALRRFAPK